MTTSTKARPTAPPAAPVSAARHTPIEDVHALLIGSSFIAVGLTLLEAYDEGAQRLLQRSDNWPFLSRGIPALFLTTGLHRDYHTPDDDTARIDFAKLTRVTKLAARTAWLVADGPGPTMRKR